MKYTAHLAILILLIFVTGCSAQKPLTVSEVIENAKMLEGKTIRVRGLAYLWIDPTRAEMWMSGGCAPNTDASYSSQGNVVGWLTLYDQIDPNDLKNYGVPHDEKGVKISEANFHCEGNYCRMTCSPFEVTSQGTYEFVGTLRVNEEAELILEDLDLNRSSQLVDEKWIPIPTGNFNLMFP